MTDENSQRQSGNPSRRALLKSASLASLSLAGCLGIASSEDYETPAKPTQHREPTGTPTATSTRTDPSAPTATSTAAATPTPTPTPTPTARPAPDHYVYVSHSELEAIAECVRDGQKPWTPAYRQAMKDANDALEMSPRSVVDDGAPKWDDPHQFGTDEDRHDYGAAIDMTTAVRDAALAYWFTQQEKYAERAIDLLYHWCLDPETKMNPSGDIAKNGTEIELYVTIPKLWYGAALLGDHPYWTEKTGEDLEAKFESWVRSFVETLADPGYFQFNNMWAWRIATIAGAGSYLDDQALVDHAFCMWRANCETAAHGKERPRPWGQYGARRPGQGALERELTREDGFGYHVYGMKALTTTAEIARHRGVDLYSYNAPTDPRDGSTLKKLFNFMAPYMKSPSAWKWGTGSDGVTNYELGTYASLYELAYSRWGDEKFLDVIETIGRPNYEIRILGWTTLTHANLPELPDG